jgi:hypothetical protein
MTCNLALTLLGITAKGKLGDGGSLLPGDEVVSLRGALLDL